MHFHCVNDQTNDTVTCADMSKAAAFNCVDNVDCDPACYDGFATRSFVASDGSAFCSPCALAVYSCMRGFEIWGPVEIA